MKLRQQTFILLLSTLTLLTFSACSSSDNSNGSDSPEQPASPTVLMPLYKAGTGTELYKVSKDKQTLVKDINTADSSSLAKNFCTTDNAMYFTSTDQTHGFSLWKSTGSEASTTQVSNLYFSYVYDVTCMSERIYFVAEYNNQYGLWQSDGTQEGTYRVSSTDGPIDQASDLTRVGDSLYFTADYQGKDVLWKTNSTGSVTTILKYNNAPITDPDGLIGVDDHLFYFLPGIALWKTNGTSSGTHLIKDNFTYFYDWNMQSLNGYLLFYAEDASTLGDDVLWRSDGTTVGTVALKDANDDYFTNVSLHATPSAIYIISNNKLYKNSTTSNITTLLASASNASFRSMENVADTLYFIRQSTSNTEIWSSTGTAAGTSSLFSINNITQTTYERAVQNLINVNGTLFFTAVDNNAGTELWSSDLTQEGTSVIKDIYPGDVSSYPLDLISFQNKLFFTAHNAQYNREIWKSDGTQEGTILLKNINDKSHESSLDTYQLLFQYKGLTYFIANDGIHGKEVWVSDGTEQGTHMLKDIAVGATSNDIRNFTEYKGVLYFSAEDEEHGRELWKTDGTSDGTILVTDIYPGPKNSYPSQPKILNNKLYFSADTATGKRLFVSDGTDAGTTALIQANGNLLKNLRYLTLIGDLLYFQASGSDDDIEAYVSDGTSAGTHLLKNISTTRSTHPSNFIGTDHLTFFTASPTHGQSALYKTDGTPLNTKVLQDSDGNGLNYINDVVSLNEHVYFQATNGINPGLWMSDGNNTQLLHDYNANILNTPQNLFAHKDLLYFLASPGTEMQLYSSDGTSVHTQAVTDSTTGEILKASYATYNHSTSTLFFVLNNSSNYALDFKTKHVQKIDLNVDGCRYPELKLNTIYETSDSSTYLIHRCSNMDMTLQYADGKLKVIGDIQYEWY